MSTVISGQRSTTRLQGLDPRPFLKKCFTVNPLLTLFGLTMIVTLLGTLVGIVVDPRVITGVPAWIKPAKFALSIGIYSFTLLWMLGFVKGHKRLVAFVTSTIAISFTIEMSILIIQVIRGTTSHFNVSTPLDADLYYTMAAFIVIVWTMILIVAILLLIQRIPDPVFAWSLRLGILFSLVGMALGVLHVCPRCGRVANTYTSPEHRAKINDWGAWLCCANPACLWNGSRDYAASLNIARLGAALIRHAQSTGKVMHPSITHPSVQPVSYMGTRAALRLPPLASRGHLIASGRIYCNGWRLSVRLRSSYATPIMLRLCG